MRKRRCDCGEWATVEITVVTRTLGGRPYSNQLLLCPDCLREFRRHEEPVDLQTLDIYDR